MRFEIGDVVFVQSTWFKEGYGIGYIERTHSDIIVIRVTLYLSLYFELNSKRLTLISKGDFKFEKGDVVYWEEYDTLAMVKYDEPFLSVNGVGCIFIDDGCIRPITICVLPKALTLISKGDFK